MRWSCSTPNRTRPTGTRESSARLGRPMTRPFAALERFLERLLERPAARLFRAPLQPVQLQRRLERTMDAGRVFSADRTYVPNRYRVALNPVGLRRFRDVPGDRRGRAGRGAPPEAPALEATDCWPARRSRLVGSERVEAGDIHVTADLLDPAVLDAGANRRPIAVGRPMETRTAPGPLTMPVVAGAAGGEQRRLLPASILSPVQHAPFGIRRPPAPASAGLATPRPGRPLPRAGQPRVADRPGGPAQPVRPRSIRATATRRWPSSRSARSRVLPATTPSWVDRRASVGPGTTRSLFRTTGSPDATDS